MNRFDSYGSVESVRIFLLAVDEEHEGEWITGALFEQSLAVLRDEIDREIHRLTFEVDDDDPRTITLFRIMIKRAGFKAVEFYVPNAWPGGIGQTIFNVFL